MELALASFMTTIGFTFAEILKMLVLVGFNFVFMGIVIWRVRKPIKAFYEKSMATLDSLPKLQTSVADLNETMQEMQKQTNERLKIGDDKFIEQAREIKELAEDMKHIAQRMEKQFTEVADQIRYLQTREQIQESKQN